VKRVKKGSLAPVEREPLFEIEDEDGKTVEYTIMTTVPARLALQYLANVTAMGSERATALVLREIFGEETMTAITNSPDIDDETAKELWTAAQLKLLGALEVLQGN
jgi:hypothetical protein